MLADIVPPMQSLPNYWLLRGHYSSTPSPAVYPLSATVFQFEQEAPPAATKEEEHVSDARVLPLPSVRSRDVGLSAMQEMHP